MKMFSIDWGDGPGKFYYVASELGFESDTYPRKYVRDKQGNFYFLEPAPKGRLIKLSSSGKFISSIDLHAFLPALVGSDIIQPQELFLRPDGSIAVLLRIKLGAENREEVRSLYLSPTGSFIKDVLFASFQAKSFELDSPSFMDDEGYLWTVLDGGGCNLYEPNGALIRTLNMSVSFVDARGRLYSGSNPVKIYDRSGKLLESLRAEGDSPPAEIDGINEAGYLFSWNHFDPEQSGDLYKVPRVLTFYRPEVKQGKLVPLGALELPPNKYRVPSPHADLVERTELYENRLVFDKLGNVYFLGRSSKECWMEKIQTPFR